MTSRVRLWLKTVIAGLILVALIGTTYQGVATALERRRFPRPGPLVSVGDYQLHIRCTGAGTPTVILEAAAASVSPAWALVQRELAETLRVCAYDRAGLGWSEGDGRYVPERVPEDLLALLRGANVQGPLVLVGHELGAAYARLVAARHPEVLALVLIDDPVTAPAEAAGSATAASWPWLARIGVLRATGRFDDAGRGLPDESAGALRAFLNRPDHLTQAAREIDRYRDVVAAATATPLDPAVAITPLVTSVRDIPAVLNSRDDVARVVRAVETAAAETRRKPGS